jgi:hypothetical protein
MICPQANNRDDESQMQGTIAVLGNDGWDYGEDLRDIIDESERFSF